MPVAAVVYINDYAIQKSWKLRFRNKAGIEEIPESFYGSPDRYWFIREGKPIKKSSRWFEDGATIKKIDPKETTYEEMIATGHVHKALWLPENMVKLLVSGEPLRWKLWR